ncbi:MAG TPA: HD domain-containing protein, partial [Ktedonobacterales bacterium]|nr:HD domain-containing protein [Ktedonobacterales bacterium]
MTSPATPLAGNAATLAERFNRAVTAYLPPEDIALIERARGFAESLTDDSQTMRDVLHTGIILADMHIIDAAGIAAGMLQHVAIDSKTHTTIPDVIERIAVDFGPDAAYLIENIAHFVAIERRKGRRVTRPTGDDGADGDRRSRDRDERARRMQLETVRKMFVAMGNDPRVVVFRLAEQLRLLRDRSLPADELIALAHEARDIYAPLAGRLGMARVESELEDLAFAVLEPEEYRRTSNLVGQVRVEQRGYIEKVCAILAAEAEKNNITAEVSGRYKHMWSIYRKLVRNGWDIHQIYDLIAFRVLIASEGDPAKDEKERDREDEEKCYLMLGAVHALWQPKEDRIKDFIARPKPNGYRSLHTTVFCIDKRLAEIQIRTTMMHEDAEFGAAMHWHYKDVGDTARVDKRLTGWIQQLDDWKSDLEHRTTSSEFVASAKEENGTRSQVFVFTPQGEVKDLPYGSTPIDFAYRIHTNLGDRCAGARVTMTGPVVTQRLVPLDYVLENGQIVEILTR